MSLNDEAKPNLERWLIRAIAQNAEMIGVHRLRRDGVPIAQLLEIEPGDAKGKITETAVAIIQETTADATSLKSAQTYGLGWIKGERLVEIHSFDIEPKNKGEKIGAIEPPTEQGALAMMMRHAQDAMDFAERSFQLSIGAVDKSYAMAAGTQERILSENSMMAKEREAVLHEKGQMRAQEVQLQLLRAEKESKMARTNMLIHQGMQILGPVAGMLTARAMAGHPGAPMPPPPGSTPGPPASADPTTSPITPPQLSPPSSASSPVSEPQPLPTPSVTPPVAPEPQPVPDPPTIRDEAVELRTQNAALLTELEALRTKLQASISDKELELDLTDSVEPVDHRDEDEDRPKRSSPRKKRR